MKQDKKLCLIAALLASGAVTHFAFAQARPQDAALIARRNALEKELESIAIIDRKVMVPMRDGKRSGAAQGARHAPPACVRSC